MKILVTGAAGFIGSHIADALIQQGHDVVAVDDLSTGRVENLNPQARFYQISIADPALAKVFEAEHPDIVNHQAAQIAIQKSVADPIFDAEVNILGSLNLIVNCLRYGIKKFIFASSGGAIYGDPEYIPVQETHPANPVSPYGVSKYAVECYLRQCNIHNSLPYVVLRYANIYGPRQNPRGEAGVVAIFVGKMLKREKPGIFGHGDKTRDYVHVSDVVIANILAVEKGENAIYNIATGVETSDQKIFDTLAELLNYRGEPEYLPVRKGEVYRICLDASKAHKELGWKPKMDLKAGLAQTVEFYRSNPTLSGATS